jgi:thiamine transport system permease protein
LRPRLSVWLLWLVPLAFLAVFYFYPLSSILSLSFSRVEGGLSQIADVLGDASLHRVVGFTFWQALLSTALTLAVGLPGAFLLARYRFPGKSLLRAISGIPFVLPTLVVAAAFDALLGPRGWANIVATRALGFEQAPILFVNTFGAILVAHVFYNVAIVLRLVGDFWARLSPRIEQAARTLGASPWRTFRYVTLPSIAPAVSAAALLVFLFVFTSFGVILTLGGPRFSTLETEIYYQTVALFDLPAAAVLSLIQLAFTLILTVVYARLSERVSRPVDLRASSATGRRLPSGAGGLLARGFLAALVLFIVSPLAGLALRSVSRLEPERGQLAFDEELTLDYYRALGETDNDNIFFASPADAISTSLIYAGATIVLALAVGIPAAWALARNENLFANRVIDPILMLPLGTSAVTLGLGFIIALDWPPLDLRASPLLIPLAHTLVALPLVVRSLAPALRSIRPHIRQAAAVLGASPWKVIRHIDLPLVGRAVAVSAVFAFAVSIGEFGATALIARPEYPTIPVLIYRLLSQPGALTYGQAMALSTILMAMTGLGLLVIERLRVADVGEF